VPQGGDGGDGGGGGGGGGGASDPGASSSPSSTSSTSSGPAWTWTRDEWQPGGGGAPAGGGGGAPAAGGGFDPLASEQSPGPVGPNGRGAAPVSFGPSSFSPLWIVLGLAGAGVAFYLAMRPK
jgi:hypothetical protein